MSNSSPKSFKLLEPQTAWMAILGLVMPTTLCLLVGFSNILQILFPAGSFVVGVFLYYRYPILYLGFNWWLWFICPFISRLVEYQNGLTDPGLRLIILSPYLVTMMTAVTFFKHFPKIYRRDGLPFVFSFLAIVYSLLVGVAKGNSIPEIVQSLLSWIPGIFLGVHFLVNWQDYPSYQKNTQRTFLWGVLVMGIYGIVQYIVAPEWDKFWLKNAEELQLCCGWPEPMMIRVWSTLNYPFTFAYVMMVGLLLIFSNQNRLVFPALIVGFMSFLLSEVRAAWGGCFLGLVLVIISLKPRYQSRLVLTILLIFICLSPLVAIEPFSETITTRLQTLTNVGEDHSFNERAKIYNKLVEEATSEFNGRGMGGKKIIDAGLLDVIATLGWFGLIPYTMGILLIFWGLFQCSEVSFDVFMNALRSGVISILITLPATNTMVLLPGVMFWSFSGLILAGHKYYSKIQESGVINHKSGVISQES